eukprot:NODE_1007_length_2283_cov_0.244048.p2 type:complete len:113 gc:universal NODE_1007_length_2283_cov_0.244048:236-574(+)
MSGHHMNSHLQSHITSVLINFNLSPPVLLTMIHITRNFNSLSIFIDDQHLGRYEDNELVLNGIYYKLLRQSVYNLFTHKVVGNINETDTSETNNDKQALLIFSAITKNKFIL